MIVVAGVLAALSLLLSSGGGSPSWAPGPGRVLSAEGGCGAPGPDLGFSSLPPIQEMPVTGLLPAAPNRVFVSSDGSIVAPRQRYEMVLFDATRNRAARHWTVKAQMLALGQHGEALEEVSHGRTKPDPSDESRGLLLKVGKRLGFYQVDVEVEETPGQPPAEFSMYLLAVSSGAKGRLGIDRERFRPGQSVLSRVEDLGTEPLLFGDESRVQRLVDGSWRRAPIADWSDLVQYAIEPGGFSQCFETRLPASIPPGRYRLVKQVETYAKPHGYDYHYLTARFQVHR